MRRCRETAQFTADRLGLEVEVDDGFAESAFGEWDGRTLDDYIAERTAELSALKAAGIVVDTDAAVTELKQGITGADALKHTKDRNFGGTDCALPMEYARKHKLKVDVFVVYTDNETWAGKLHPAQALAEYRQATGIPAKLVVMGMCSNGFTIANPNDPGMLDVVGFDASVPQAMREFVIA